HPLSLPLPTRRSSDLIHQVAQTIIRILKVFTVCIDILAEQRDFLIALCRQLAYFLNDIFRPPASFFPAGHRHNTVRAELVTSIQDRKSTRLNSSHVSI